MTRHSPLCEGDRQLGWAAPAHRVDAVSSACTHSTAHAWQPHRPESSHSVEPGRQPQRRTATSHIARRTGPTQRGQ